MRARFSSHTAQQLDPLGGITARYFAIGAAVSAIAISIGMSVSTFDRIDSPVLEIVALLLMAGAGGHYIRATSPFRAPFRRVDHVLLYTFGVGAVVCSAAAQWGSNLVVRDDWAPIALAILTFTLGSWRPGWEILLCAGITSLLVAAIAIVQADTFSADVPYPVFGIITAAPLLASAAAASAFSNSLVRTLLTWRTAATAEATAVAAAPTTGPPAPEPGGHPNPRQLDYLDAQVVPFLTGLTLQEALSEAEVDQARRFADELQRLIAEESAQSWLSQLEPGADDPLKLAVLMNSNERGFVRALVDHLRTGSAYSREGLTLTLDMGERWPSCVVVVPCLPGASARVQLAPYIAVARTVFRAVDWQLVGGQLEICLTFDVFRQPKG